MTKTKHWAYNLPPIIDPVKGHIYWVPETIERHKNPEYWASLWGFSKKEIEEAKSK